jgi:hypothetical protein
MHEPIPEDPDTILQVVELRGKGWRKYTEVEKHSTSGKRNLRKIPHKRSRY